MWKSDKFFWGAATSAYQVEGGIKNDFSEIGMDAGGACDHYNLFEKDFEIARSLDHNAHRFSLEWARIEPEEGKFDSAALDHYRKVLVALRERGLEPFVTLWHFTNPVWLSKHGGWQNKKAIFYFARYIENLARAFKDDVRFWITINEPEIYADHAYLFGIWPPYKKNFLNYLKVRRNLVAAHQLAYGLIKKINPIAEVGIAKNNIYYEAVNKNPWNQLLKRVSDYWWNFLILDRIQNQLDFIGLNYYFHNRIDGWFNKNQNKKVSDLGWEIYPEGIYYVLKDLQRYKKPIYVTENGIADANDQYRADFIKDHLTWIKKAESGGVDVRGYFHWSLLDNFEWQHGFKPRFGLVEVNYETMERKIRQSAHDYAKIISNP